MKNYVVKIIIGMLFCSIIYAQKGHTLRVEEFTNSQVSVWKTVIYPSGKQTLPMHRHDKDRVVIALTEGVLKITNNLGKTHFLRLKKDKAYFLPKDAPGELHNDENISQKLIKVIVIQLNK